jgi:hypothetical protein
LNASPILSVALLTRTASTSSPVRGDQGRGRGSYPLPAPQIRYRSGIRPVAAHPLRATPSATKHKPLTRAVAQVAEVADPEEEGPEAPSHKEPPPWLPPACSSSLKS